MILEVGKHDIYNTILLFNKLTFALLPASDMYVGQNLKTF